MKADAGAGLLEGIAGPEIGFEHARQVLPGNADAVVAHRHHRFAALAPADHLDERGRLGIFHGVGKQVGEKMFDESRIAMDVRRQAGQVDGELPLRRQILMAMAQFAEQPGKVEPDRRIGEQTLLDRLGVQDALDQGENALHRQPDFARPMNDGVVGLGGAVEDQLLGVAVDAGERGAELVGYHGHECPLRRRLGALLGDRLLQCGDEQQPVADQPQAETDHADGDRPVAQHRPQQIVGRHGNEGADRDQRRRNEGDDHRLAEAVEGESHDHRNDVEEPDRNIIGHCVDVDDEDDGRQGQNARKLDVPSRRIHHGLAPCRSSHRHPGEWFTPAEAARLPAIAAGRDMTALPPRRLPGLLTLSPPRGAARTSPGTSGPGGRCRTDG